jgi:hypothetical protein
MQVILAAQPRQPQAWVVTHKPDLGRLGSYAHRSASAEIAGLLPRPD